MTDMMLFTWGEAVSTRHGLAVFLFGALSEERVWIWRERLYLVSSSTCRPWTCPACGGTRVSWSLRHAPTCARCTPMSPSVFEAAWADASNLIARLMQGAEDPADRAALCADLDDVLLRGNLDELLRLGIVHKLMELRDKQADREG